MDKVSKNLLVLFLALLLGSYFSIDFVQAQGDGLSLGVTQPCNIKSAGNSCIAELKITNNTGEILDGEASLRIDYRGVCGDGPFDGEGIQARFYVTDDNWLNFSNWENGTTAVSGFEIAKGETQPKLKIETVPNLCPGEYTFICSIKGEEYITPPIPVGGGGGGSYTSPTTPSPTTQGDINGDDKVDKYDFALMMAAWGQTGVNSSDLNGDNKVDKYDFALLMLNWS